MAEKAKSGGTPPPSFYSAAAGMKPGGGGAPGGDGGPGGAGTPEGQSGEKVKNVKVLLEVFDKMEKMEQDADAKAMIQSMADTAKKYMEKLDGGAGAKKGPAGMPPTGEAGSGGPGAGSEPAAGGGSPMPGAAA